MENDNKTDILSFEKFNKITKKDLYKVYKINKDRIKHLDSIIDNSDIIINERNNIIKSQITEIKICKIVIWILLIIILLLSITLVVF